MLEKFENIRRKQRILTTGIWVATIVLNSSGHGGSQRWFAFIGALALLVVCWIYTARNWRCPSCENQLRGIGFPKCANCGTELLPERLRPFRRQAGYAFFGSVFWLSIALIFLSRWSTDLYTKRAWTSVDFSLIPVMLATSLLLCLSGWSWKRSAPVRAKVFLVSGCVLLGASVVYWLSNPE